MLERLMNFIFRHRHFDAKVSVLNTSVDYEVDKVKESAKKAMKAIDMADLFLRARGK